MRAIGQTVITSCRKSEVKHSSIVQIAHGLSWEPVPSAGKDSSILTVPQCEAYGAVIVGAGRPCSCVYGMWKAVAQRPRGKPMMING